MSLILLYLSCISPELTERTSIELVEMTHTGDLLSIRWVQTNTGLMKNQAHLKVNYFRAKQNPIEYSFHAPESEHVWNDTMLQFGVHTLEKQETQWLSNIHDNDFNIRLESVSVEASPCQFQTEDWSVEILSLRAEDKGWIQAQKRSVTLKGNSFLIKHHGNKVDSNPHRSLLLQSSDLQVYYEDWGEFQYGCARKNGILTPLSETNISWSDSGATLEIQDQKLNILWRKNLGIEDPYQHLISPERWIANSQFSLNSVHWIQGYAQFENSSANFYPLVFRYQGPSPPEIKARKTKPTFANPPKPDSLPKKNQKN